MRKLTLLVLIWLLGVSVAAQDGSDTQYKIVFNVEAIDNPGVVALYVANLDGSGRRQLTNLIQGTEENPSWTPDGKAVVFESNRSVYAENTGYDAEKKLSGGQIYIVHLDSPLPTRLTNALRGSGSSASNPILSPDGKYIVYRYQQNIFVMKANGSQPILLFENGSAAVWSPDSCCIGITQVTQRYGFEYKIVIVDIATQAATKVIGQSRNNHIEGWSAVGNQLLFASDRNGEKEYYRMNPDGTETVQITHESSQDKGYISWSPNGKWIAYNEPSLSEPGYYDLIILTPDGELLTRLAAKIWRESKWLPDSTGLLFYTGADNRYYIQQFNTACLDKKIIQCSLDDVSSVTGTETLGIISTFAVSPIKLPSH